MPAALTRRLALAAGAALLSPLPALASNASTIIDLDTSGAPELAGWGAEVVRRAGRWWPVITSQLASPGYTAPDRVKLIIKPHEGVAETSGDVITLNSGYISGHQGDYACIAHELVHVVQAYPNGEPGWLTEGIADYMRYYVLCPQDPKRAFDPAKVDYRRGYQPAAALLAWCELRFDTRPVQKINAAMRAGKNGLEAFQAATGKTPEALWAEYLASV